MKPSLCNIPCNLCGSAFAEEIGDRDRSGNALRTVICHDCGLVWTDPRPDATATRKFYAEDYRVQYKATYMPKPKHIYRETQRAIARFDRLTHLAGPGTRMLDVGSGGGFLLYVAGKHGVSASGIEPNQGFAKFASEVLEVQTSNEFIQDVQHQPGSFDVVTLNHVLEHVEDPFGTVQRLEGWLRPEGYLVIEVPNIEATYHAPQNRFHIGHLYNFNPANLERLGLRAGLSVFQSDLAGTEKHIHVVFQKNADQVGSETDHCIPGNYERVSVILRRHTALKHYASHVPYTRFFSKQAQYLQEWWSVRDGATPREIADSLIQAEGFEHRQAA